jgi:small subunit ribosomal protein S16
MLMMRLQRVGRRNDPSYRIVVTDKRTGPKSDKHIDRLGSYNPKLNHVQIDSDKAKEWLSKGVQPSDTVHNLLINEKVIEGKKINVLPKKSPIIDEEAIKKAEEEAAAKEAAEKEAKESESATEEKVEIVADESDPEDHKETAEEDPEKVEKEKAAASQAKADAEAD